MSINTTKQKNVKTARIKNIKYMGKEDVYNMEVEEVHNFIANGVLIHNCIDATRYSRENDMKSNKLSFGYNGII